MGTESVRVPAVQPRVIRPGDALTLADAPRLARAVEQALAEGARELWLDLEPVKTTDAVGLATLLQAMARTRAAGASLAIVPGPCILAASLRTLVADDLPFVTPPAPVAPVTEIAEPLATSGAISPVAATARVALRRPAWEDLPLFAAWATDPLLDQMVGSELLYRCRQLGPHHPEFVATVGADPTSLTLVVELPGAGPTPVGFVRLYGINLDQRFAFIETAIVNAASLRHGWGVEASRLLLAYAMDTLALERVEAKVYAYNVLSANALRRNGFQHEGVLRRARRYHGQCWDIHVFSILDREMRQQRRREQFAYMGPWSAPDQGDAHEGDELVALDAVPDGDPLGPGRGIRGRRRAVRADGGGEDR